MLAFRLVGRRAPRWLLPTVAGLTMLAMHVSLERSWFPRIAAQLSGRIEIVETFERRMWWQPWTLVWPQTVRFSAIDTDSVAPLGDGLVQVEVWLVDRHQGSGRILQIYDCGKPRRADRPEGAPLEPPAAGEWIEVRPDDALRTAVCRLAQR